jgi:hypothetical protein
VVVNRTHSIVKLKRAIDEVASRGAKVIDRRTHIGRELMRWRGEVEQDLGGPESLSAQQHTVLDIAMRTKLVLDSTDYWLVKQASLVDKAPQAALPDCAAACGVGGLTAAAALRARVGAQGQACAELERLPRGPPRALRNGPLRALRNAIN